MRRGLMRSVVLTLTLGCGLLTAPFVAAQDTAAPASTVSVIGHGEASAPAERAIIQIAIGDSNFGGPSLPQPGATPGARERDSVAGVVAALVDAGISEEEIEVYVGSVVVGAGAYFGPPRAILRFPLESPDLARINELVDASAVAAADESLIVAQVNALYRVEDCGALESDAREAAIADAQGQAEIQADLLGVTIGDVTGSVDLSVVPEPDFGFYGSFSEGSMCDGDAGDPGLFRAPLYDPSVEPIVTAHARIELSFAIEDQADATPA